MLIALSQHLLVTGFTLTGLMLIQHKQPSHNLYCPVPPEPPRHLNLNHSQTT